MAFSYYNYTGDGTTTQYPVAFPYIRREHVLAAVAGSPVTFTFVNSSTIQMDVAPANGAVVRVYRQTPLTAPLVDFADGATLVAADLDTNAKQSIYTQQELSDSQEEGLANVIPNGDKGDITTSVGGTIWTVDTGAVTEAKIASGAVTEAKIGSGAVIEAKIGTGAVIEAKIGTGAVTAAKLAAGAFTDSVSSTSSTTIAKPNSVKTAYDLAEAALPKAGGTMTGVITYATAQPGLVRETAKATTSGSTVDFTGLPSWIKRFTVVLDNVSVTGTDNVLIQLGDSGGIETTGYISSTTYVSTVPSFNGGGFSSTSGVIVTAGAPQNWPTGSIVFENISGNRWIASGVFNFANLTGANGTAAGEKTLSATLDRVQITVTGTDTFDNGSVNIIYEG
jgi:hypothetical protein